jgi:hypothetical protein
MALRVAVANGNWSNPAIWNNGVLPGAGDIVASNGFTVTIDQNVTVDSLSNAVTTPQILSAPMTGYTTPSGIVTASSFLYDAFLPWYAFNQGYQEWLSSTFNPPQWLAYEFPVLRTVKTYQVVAPGNNAPQSVPRDWTFEGWNGTSWVILDTVTGNSGTATVTRTLTNTTAYIKYRINITANNGNAAYVGISELRMYEANDYMVNSVAGGGFILNSGFSVAANLQGLGNGNAHCLTYSGSGTAAITGNIYTPVNTGIYRTLRMSGSGILNWVGDLTPLSSSGNSVTVEIASTGGTLNWVGNNNGSSLKEPRYYLLISGTSTVNQTGNITNTDGSGNNYTLVSVGAGCTYNITGFLNFNLRGNAGFSGIENFGNTNIVGSVNMYGGYLGGISSNTYLSIIGPITQVAFSTFLVGQAVYSTSLSAINLFSGPFVCSEYGYMPFLVARMHLIPTINSYFEFRDETTNGALSPGAIAPATRLVSPATIADNPIPANVRFGTVYSIGSQTGTLRMPHPNQVTYGVAVDNTFGNAVLTAGSVWDYLVANITVENSIGMRLKNVSTPQTTGEQLEAFLRLE